LVKHTAVFYMDFFRGTLNMCHFESNYHKVIYSP